MPGTDQANMTHWRCEECNMKFESLTLYETHKRKFCVGGKVGDPSEIQSRQNGYLSTQSPLPHIRLTSSSSAPSTPGRPTGRLYCRSELSPKDMTWARQTSLSAPATPDNLAGLSVLERAKIEQLKLLKARNAVERSSKDLEEKLLLASTKNNQLSKMQRTTRAEQRQGISPDERVRQLIRNHQEQLDELKDRHARLEQEKSVIQERMDSLNLKSRQKRDISTGNVERQLAELEGLKKYLDYKDKQHRKEYDASLSRLEQLEAKTPPSPAESNKSYEQSRARTHAGRQDLELALSQVPSKFPLYGSVPALQVYPQQRSVLSEINALKSSYLQKGGNDPVVLAQIRDLELEALATQGFPSVQKTVSVDPVVQQQLMAYQLSNQRLEQEIQMLREERQLRERKRFSPDINPEYQLLKEEHMKRMVSLRQESEILKQEAEIEKVKRELKELRGEQDLPETNKGLGTPFIMSESGLEKLFQPSPYDPKGGFAVFWDFILGMPSSFSKCRIAAGVYEGVEVLSDVKLLPSAGVSILTKAHYPQVAAGGAAVFGMKHPFPSCAPSQALSLVVELQASSTEESIERDKLFSWGWAKVDLFDATSRLISGRWKIPLRVSPIKVHLNTCELNRISQAGQAELYLRLVNARDISSEEFLNPQPQQHYLYKFPRMENTVALYHQPPLVGEGAPFPPPSVRPLAHSPAPASRQSLNTSSSVPPTTSSDSMVGFQLDLLMDAIKGEARIKITAYDKLDGQILKAENDRAVLCATNSVMQDFLEGVYSFGLQEAQFKNVSWNRNSLVVLRLYLYPASAQGPLTGNLLDENNLAAWTVIPLAVDDHASRSGRSSQGRQNSRGQLKLNVGSHWLPLFFPPVPNVQHMQLTPGSYAEDWNRYGEATVAFNIFSLRSPPLARPSTPTEFREEDDLPQDVWIRHSRPSVVAESFEPGDGFDLYIDGARFLPDSITVSKVVGKVFDKNFIIVGPEFDVQAELDSDICNPRYNVRVEHRDSVLPPVSTLLIKLYTVDRVKKELSSVGFGFLPIFLDLDTSEQPSVRSDSDTKVSLNKGAHQIRLYSGHLDVKQPLHETVTQTLSAVPCASLLVRVTPAACHPNGRPKKISEFSQRNWVEEGLVQPTPSYSEGSYFSLSCEPTPGECQILHSMVKREPITVRDSIHFIGDEQDGKLKKDKVIASWIKTRLTRSIDSVPPDFDLNYVALYHPLHGLKVSVDAAQNLEWSNFTLASYCFSPPGSFYRTTREDGLSYATKLQFSEDVTCPVWLDGFKSFPRRSYHKFLVLIVHLHEVVVDVSQSKSAHGLQRQAWTAVPVFHKGYVMNGCYQLPLYTEEPPEAVLNALQTDFCQDVLSNFRRRKVINFMEGSSVFIRLCDARRAEELPQPKAKAKQDFLPRERLDKYRASSPSVPLSSLIPPDTHEQEFARDLRAKFITLTSRLLEKKQSEET